MQVLLRLLNLLAWHKLWRELAIEVESFTSLGVPTNTPDADLGQLCQSQETVLITGNRNEEDATSLESTIQTANTPEHLPVLTVGEPQRILSSHTYAESVVERLGHQEDIEIPCRKACNKS